MIAGPVIRSRCASCQIPWGNQAFLPMTEGGLQGQRGGFPWQMGGVPWLGLVAIFGSVSGAWNTPDLFRTPNLFIVRERHRVCVFWGKNEREEVCVCVKQTQLDCVFVCGEIHRFKTPPARFEPARVIAQTALVSFPREIKRSCPWQRKASRDREEASRDKWAASRDWASWRFCVTFSFEILLILTLSDTFWTRERMFWISRKLCFCYGFSVAFTISRMPQKATVPDSTKIQKSEKLCAFVYYIIFWNLADMDTFRHILDSRADFLNLPRKLSFCYGFYMAFTISRMPQKTTVPDSTKIQKSEKIPCIFLLHSLLNFCWYLHFLTHFGLASGFSESSEKLCFCYGFSMAFTISRMPQKTTIPDSTEIQKSEKWRAFFCYILFWFFADMVTFWHILHSRADFLNLPIKLCFCYGFFVAFTISRMSQKTTCVLYSTKI